MRGIVVACVAAVLGIGAVGAQDKKDPKKDDKKVDPARLVGKWELTRSTDKGAPQGAVVEFTKDNKVLIAITTGGKQDKYDGTYRVNGDKLSVKLNDPESKDKEDTDTIRTLTDDKLVLIDSNGKENEFTRKKN
jgi:uncharacterized protein (TIGR03066 family)